jgi:hypothetical protein
MQVLRVEIPRSAQARIDDGLARFVSRVIQAVANLGREPGNRRRDAALFLALTHYIDASAAHDRGLARLDGELRLPAILFVAGQRGLDLDVIEAERFERLTDLAFGFLVGRTQLRALDAALLIFVELESLLYGFTLFLGEALDFDVDIRGLRMHREEERKTCEPPAAHSRSFRKWL